MPLYVNYELMDQVCVNGEQMQTVFVNGELVFTAQPALSGTLIDPKLYMPDFQFHDNSGGHITISQTPDNIDLQTVQLRIVFTGSYYSGAAEFDIEVDVDYGQGYWDFRCSDGTMAVISLNAAGNDIRVDWWFEQYMYWDFTIMIESITIL
jgi:hypothetical protein